jgi:hypothetical protein
LGAVVVRGGLGKAVQEVSVAGAEAKNGGTLFAWQRGVGTVQAAAVGGIIGFGFGLGVVPLHPVSGVLFVDLAAEPVYLVAVGVYCGY